MPLIRDAVGREETVPEEALPYFLNDEDAGWKVVKEPSGGEKSTAKTTTTKE